MSENKTLGQTYHDEVEALKLTGTTNAEAIREVAAKHGKTEGAIRGSLHQHKTKLNGGTATTRTRRNGTQSVDDYLTTARRALEQALDLIDGEVAAAKAALDVAQARYDEVLAGVDDRKADIEAKLTVLA